MSERRPGFRVILRMQIKPGMAEGFERTWHEVAEAVTEQPANLGHWLMRSAVADEQDVYYIGSDWIDEGLFREFESSPTHIEHRTRLHPYRVAGTISLMEVLDHKRGAAAAPA